MRLLEQGVASKEGIDAAMKGGCGFPMGPFALLDLVGLDTSVAILDALYAEFRRSRTTPPSPCCGAWSRSGQLGRKTGRGFYEYEDCRWPRLARLPPGLPEPAGGTMDGRALTPGR